MIHFDFIVNEKDAETIFSCIDSRIVDFKYRIMKISNRIVPYKNDDQIIDSYKKGMDSLENLKSKMKNKKLSPSEYRSLAWRK